MGEFLYSNLGYMVAAAMAESLTEKELGDLDGGGTSSPPWVSPRQDSARRTRPIPSISRGGIIGAIGLVLTPSQYDNPEAMGPSGRVHISIEDWAKFIALWFSNQTPAILDRTVLDELLVPDSGSALGDYAAGWSIQEREWAGGTALDHDGSNGAWRTTLWIAPDRGIAYLAAANAADLSGHDTIYWMLDSIVGSLINETVISE